MKAYRWIEFFLHICVVINQICCSEWNFLKIACLFFYLYNCMEYACLSFFQKIYYCFLEWKYCRWWCHYITCKTCHYSWSGWGNNWVVLTKQAGLHSFCKGNALQCVERSQREPKHGTQQQQHKKAFYLSNTGFG